MSTPKENFISDNQCNLNNSNINILPTLSETPTTAIETNPTTKMDPTSKNVDITSCNDESNLMSNQQQQQEKPAQESVTMQSPGDKDDDTTTTKGKDENDADDVQQQQNDSSTFSTAFTISFEDDTNTSKKLGIKDSIRKFAPPKPHTIEKPRQPKNNDQSNQDHSLVSVESAPAGLSKHSNRKGGGCSNSSRSSSRKSNSSRHSNISESAAFLIDKMLNCKQTDELAELSPRDRQHKQHKHGSSSGSKSQHAKSPTSQGGSKKVQPKRLTHSSDDILDSELDFCEDRSDNGTYIVGADPESEAARKKIDELFGVVKAAEASVLAESRSRSDKAAAAASCGVGGRQSRLTDKKPLNRERQEHINRLAYRNSSRSSSSSRQDNLNHHQPRSSSRHNHNSRNSSCERTPRASGGGGGGGSGLPARPRRSASQSSRQSSNKEPSDGDTRSSRSSLHNDADLVSNHESSISNHPSMKFNRAFALRRARLGLGEPVRVTQQQHLNQTYSQQQEIEATTAASVNNMSSSQRRHQINSNTYRASQQQHHQQQQGHSTSSGSANFCRDDGGRFSLRMKNNALPSRLSSSANAPASGRLPQHLGAGGSALIDSYINKVSSGGGSKNCAPANVLVGALVQHQQQQQQQENQRNYSSPKNLNQSSCSSTSTTGVPFQSDEPEIMSHSRYRLFKAGRLPKKGLSDLEASDTDSYANHHQRFNYSLNNSDCYEATNNSYSLGGECSRANSSVGSKQQRGSNLQLGALDSLVISAISSLSLKIRDSVCEVLVDHAKKLPIENETRLIVEEILPQLTTNPSSSKSPTSIEEIDQSLYFDLAKTLKNLKKVEQMVDVINHISNQLPSSSASSPAAANQIATSISSSSSIQHHHHHQQQQHNNNLGSSLKSSSGRVGSSSSIVRATSDSATNSDINSVNDLSPV